MRLFNTPQDDASLEPKAVHLLWRYEVSGDGGKTWYPETQHEDDGSYVLRRGNWVAPALN